MTDQILVSTLSTGSYGLNNFAGFTNTPGEIYADSYYTTTLANYFRATDPRYFVVQTIAEARDIEVTTWTKVGVIMVRISGDRALFFSVMQEGGTPAWEIGLAIGVSPGGDVGGWVMGATKRGIDGGNCADIPGYVQYPTDGATFTFGVTGADIYVKYNGVEFCRRKQYLHFDAGPVGLAQNSSYGFRDLTVEYPVVTSYSDWDNKILDVRDYGFKTTQTTGTIAEGSDQLTVADASGFAVGDRVIVEFGAEATGGVYGSIGVGGAWPFPPAQYANQAAMQADNSQPVDSYGLDLSDNTVWYHGAAPGWSQLAQGLTGGLYYVCKANGLALGAKITAINGSVLTLDKTAVKTATNANVYFNNAIVAYWLMGAPSDISGYFNDVIPSDITVSFTAGLFAFWNDAFFSTGRVSWGLVQRKRWTVRGQGDSTIIFTPKGTRCAEIVLYQCEGCILQDFKVVGNARDAGFGFGCNDTATPNVDRPYTPSGILHVLSFNGVTRRISFRNVWGSVGGRICWDYLVEDCSTVLDDGPLIYLTWHYGFANSNNCVLRRCKAVCEKRGFPGFETFQSTGISFIDCYSINGIVSTNSSPQYLFDNLYVEMLPGCYVNEAQNSKYNPIINFNSNINWQQGIAAPSVGGLFLNPTIIQRGLADIEGTFYFTPFGVDQSCTNVTLQADPPWTQRPVDAPLEKGYILSPDVSFYNIGDIRNDGGSLRWQSGDNFVCIGIRVDGGSTDEWSNQISVGAPYSHVQNCVAEKVKIFPENGSTASGNMTHAEWIEHAKQRVAV